MQLELPRDAGALQFDVLKTALFYSSPLVFLLHALCDIERVGRHKMTRILAVDDESGPRESVRFLLKHAGYEVLVADSGCAALEQLALGGIGLMITGIIMPGMSGIELIQTVQKKYPGVKVIVLAGSFGISRFRKAVEQGEKLDSVTACLQKPFDSETLRSLVRKTLGDDSLKVSAS